MMAASRYTPTTTQSRSFTRRTASSSSELPGYERLQRAEQRLRIMIALVDVRWLGAALQQCVDRFPGRASRILDGERHLLLDFDVLADETEIGGSRLNWRRTVGTRPRHPDIVDERHIAWDAFRGPHDRVELLIEPQLPQHFLEDLGPGAIGHRLLHERSDLVGIEAIAPPDLRAIRLPEDLRLMEERQRDHPVGVLQRHQPAPPGLALCHRGQRIDERIAGVGDREGDPPRVGDRRVAEEHARIAEAWPAFGQLLPQ